MRILTFVFVLLLPVLANAECMESIAMENITKGDEFAAVGDVVSAIAHYNDAIRACPDGALAYHQRAMINFGRGQFDLAAKDYERVIKMRPKWSSARKGLAWALYKGGKVKAALEHAEMAVEMRPKDWHALHTLMLVYFHLGRDEEAIETHHTLVREDPEYRAVVSANSR